MLNSRSNFNFQEGKRACDIAREDILMFQFRDVVLHAN